MKTFAIYQIPHNPDAFDAINKNGWDVLEHFPDLECQQKLSVHGSEKLVITDSVFFHQVCNIDAEDLEDVFRVGNMGPENQIERIQHMHSLSVGDIVVDKDNGQSFMCNPFGFERINFNVNMAGGVQ
jgi:hypothetical protein